MPHAARLLEEEAQPEKIVSFKFMILDDTFYNQKTKQREPVQFIFEDWHVELHHGITYKKENLPEGIDLDALVAHLNSRPGYPVHEYRPVQGPDGKELPGVSESVQTGWEARFECVNMRYA